MIRASVSDAREGLAYTGPSGRGTDGDVPENSHAVPPGRGSPRREDEP